MSAALFRCDAARSVGLGHLSRCLNLADALRGRSVACTFAMQPRDPSLNALVTQRGHRLAVLPVSPQEGFAPLTTRDAEETARLARELGAVWVIVDTYAATATTFQLLGQLLGQRPGAAGLARLLAIDDLGQRDLFACDIMVNPTLGSASWTHRVGAGTTVLAGAEYALIHPVFAELRRTRTSPRGAGGARERVLETSLQRVLVALGGLDAGNHVASVLDALRLSYPGAEVSVIAAAAQEHAKLLGHGPARTSFLPLQAPPALAELMLWADLAVATPSTIAWELSCLALPSILLLTADNQRRVAEELSQRQVASICWSVSELPAAIEGAGEFVARAASRARWAAVCDGEGAARVASAMLSMQPKES